MTNIHAAGLSNLSDRISEPLRTERNVDTGNILQQLTPEDRRAAHGRQDTDRRRDADHPALPRMEIINVQAIDHTQITATPFDRDRNSRITSSELEQTVGNRGGRYVGADQMAVALRRNFPAIASLNPRDGSSDISTSDLSALNRLPSNNPLARQINEEMNRVPSYGLNERLFDRRHGVIPDAVRQGTIGDCTLLSALTSLASNERGRQFILQMVQQEGNGFRVRFGGRPPISTPRPTAGELGIYAGDANHGIWPSVVERAFGMARNGDPLRPQTAGHNLSAQSVLGTLFGDRGTRTHIPLSSLNVDALHTQLSSIAPNAMVMMANTQRQPNAQAERVDAHGRRMPVATEALVGRHSYAVDSYDAATRTVTLRNPWDSAVRLRMPLATFHRNFMNFDSVQPPW